jgi:hypothetical protein
MDPKALRARRMQFKKRRDAELRACQAKWRRRINSVDRLLKVAGAANENMAETRSGQASRVAVLAKALEGKVNGDRKKGMMEVVRQTLRHNQGFFTARALVEFINQTLSCSVTEREISHPLWSLRQLGEIRLVEKGKGRTSHMYLKL